MTLPKILQYCRHSIRLLRVNRRHWCFSPRMASTSSNFLDTNYKGTSVVGVCQMTSMADKDANFAVCRYLIEQAKKRGVQMVFLPEAFDYIAESKEQSVAMAESLDGDLVSRYCDTACQNQMWLSLGGFHQKGPKNDPKRVQNTHLLIDSEGNIRATYNKSHLFDLDLQGRVRLCESDYTVPGRLIVPPVSTPVGKVALSTTPPELKRESKKIHTLGTNIQEEIPKFTETKIMKILTDVPNLRITQRAGEGLNDPIMLANVLLVVRELSSPTRYPETKSLQCYDVRFPELSVALTQQGADILTFPSAFTQTTGMAHWEVLLRARAIENQCYVVAAAQTGKHNAKRTSYGHAMIVDPWGTVVAQCREGTDLAVAAIDLNYLAKIRQEMPVWNHRRHDLYSQVISLQCSADDIDEQAEYQFGHIKLESTCVFARSSLSFAFVNIKPVLPGHMLVASLRPAKHIGDLTQAEVSDLFTLAQRVSDVAKRKFDASSVTIAVQDGPDSGQTVQHVHIHVLPRRPGDMEQNDDIYYELQKHDRDLSSKSPGLRTKEQMAEEAAVMRTGVRESS